MLALHPPRGVAPSRVHAAVALECLPVLEDYDCVAHLEGVVDVADAAHRLNGRPGVPAAAAVHLVAPRAAAVVGQLVLAPERVAHGQRRLRAGLVPVERLGACQLLVLLDAP